MKKTNSLLDNRFGENDSTLSADEKMVQRFALEKKVVKNIFYNFLLCCLRGAGTWSAIRVMCVGKLH